MPAPVMKLMNATGRGGKKWRAKPTEDVLNELNLSEKCRAVLVSPNQPGEGVTRGGHHHDVELA